MHQIKVESVTISMKTNCSHVSKYRSLCSVTLSQITARLPSQSVISGLPGVCVALPTAHKPVTCSVGVIIGMKWRYGQLKGKCSDWESTPRIPVLHFVRVLLTHPSFSPLAPNLLILKAWQSCWHLCQKMIFFFFHLALDWLHLPGVTPSENTILLLIYSSFLGN